MSEKNGKVILAYTGGLDSSVISKWLDEQGYEVTALMVDVGQGEDLESINKKALLSGASKTVVMDQKDELMVAQFDILRVGAICENGYKLGGAFTKPFIAKKHAELAMAEGALIAHGAHQRQNDFYRFGLNYQLFAPGVEVLTPWTDPNFLGLFKHREDMIEYAVKYGISVEATIDKPFTTEPGLFLVGCFTKVIGDQRNEQKIPTDDMHIVCTPPHLAPEEPGFVEIEYQAGNPVKITDKTSGYSTNVPLEMIAYLNHIGATHGIGRLLTKGRNEAGMEYWGYYEEPGQSQLYFSHGKLDDAIPGSVPEDSGVLRTEYTGLVYKGDWFAGRRPQLQKIFDKAQEAVNGTVSLSLRKGEITLVGINES